MKTITIVIIFALMFNSKNQEEKSFFLEVIDINASMASSLKYVFTDKKLLVLHLNGLDNSINDTLENRFLTKKEVNEIKLYFQKDIISKLHQEYSNPLVEDGKRIQINIVFDNKRKSIFVSNIYVEDIYLLINFLNKFISQKYHIVYQNYNTPQN